MGCRSVAILAQAWRRVPAWAAPLSPVAPPRLRGPRVDATTAIALQLLADEDDVPPLGVVDAAELGTFGPPAARRAASWPRHLPAESEADRARARIVARNAVAEFLRLEERTAQRAAAQPFARPAPAA